AEQQRITRTQNAAYSAQEFGIRGAIEISDRASQKQHQQLLARAAVVGHFKKSVEILALEPHDADVFDIAQFALHHSERGMGNFDGAVPRLLTVVESFEQVTGFLAAAAA